MREVTKTYEVLAEENSELKGIMRKLCHEMGNALTLLGGSLFYLENEIGIDKTNRRMTILKNDYAYICRLFADLREYNHTEATDKSDVEIEWIIKNIEDVYIKLNKEGNIRFLVECEADIDKNKNNIKIYGDITKLRQVIVNIIKNSIEAIEENSDDRGKEIIVKISRERLNVDKINEIDVNEKNLDKKNLDKKDLNKKDLNKKEINIDGYDKRDAGIDEMIHIEFRDNGKGISDENISDIFKPMFTREKKNGTGLGLAVVKKIVEDHCGKIKAVSTKGVGTAMNIYLPIL